MAFVRKCCDLDEAIVDIDFENNRILCGDFHNSSVVNNTAGPWAEFVTADALYYNNTFGNGDRIISVGVDWPPQISKDGHSMIAPVDDGFRAPLITFPPEAYCLDIKVNPRDNITQDIVLVLKWFPDLETFLLQTKFLVIPFMIGFCFLLPLVLIYWRLRKTLTHIAWLQFHHFLARFLCVVSVTVEHGAFAFTNRISYYWTPFNYFHITMRLVYHYLLLVLYVSFCVLMAEMLRTFWVLRPTPNSVHKKKRLLIQVAMNWLLPLLILILLYGYLFSCYFLDETPVYSLYYRPIALPWMLVSCQVLIVVICATTVVIIFKHRMGTRMVAAHRKSDVALFFKLLTTTEIPAVIYMFILESNLLSSHWGSVVFVWLVLILSSVFALIIYGLSKQHVKGLQQSTPQQVTSGSSNLCFG